MNDVISKVIFFEGLHKNCKCNNLNYQADFLFGGIL